MIYRRCSFASRSSRVACWVHEKKPGLSETPMDTRRERERVNRKRGRRRGSESTDDLDDDLAKDEAGSRATRPPKVTSSQRTLFGQSSPSVDCLNLQIDFDIGSWFLRIFDFFILGLWTGLIALAVNLIA